VPRLTDRRTYAAPIAACFDNPSIGTEADSAGLSWRFYSGAIDDDGGLWSSYQADRNVFHTRDWHADVIDPPSRFLTDIAKGQLANITWIAPTYENSDHAAMNRGTGPTWVASVVNSIGTSRFWKTTAIFIMWDDWGGWFDPVKPVYEDYDGLGFRVPLIIISPYAKRGYVTHVQYETASVLKYIEDNFGLPHLAASDTRANDPASDAFDYTQRPRVFRKFVGALRTSHWTQEDRAPRWRGRPKAIIGDD
jgi:phospholipase C